MVGIIGFEAFDACSRDACEFLQIDRRDFFALARKWSEFIPASPAELEHPAEWYTEWVGDQGRANICVNIVDQLSRPHILDLIHTLPALASQAGPRPFVFADIGCGSAAVSFEIARHFSKSYLIDVPNLPQEFVKWRCRKHQLDHVAVGPMEIVSEPLDVVMCIDVLEHIADSTDFFVSFTKHLRAGGLFIMQAPWYSVNSGHGHLPEAEEDWYKLGGGRDLLNAGYTTLAKWSDGGIFQKIPYDV